MKPRSPNSGEGLSLQRSRGDRQTLERDIAVVGAGVLGVTTAYWLSELYKCSVVLLDKEDAVARHTTLRNTGLVHRPYYLDTGKKSYQLWKRLANGRRRPPPVYVVCLRPVTTAS